MNPQVFHAVQKQFTGITNVAQATWAMFDFTAAPFPSTASFSVLRCTIDIDAVAIDTTKQYTRGYSATIVYTWTVSGSVGAIDPIGTSVPIANGTGVGDEFYWSFGPGTAGAPTLIAIANHSIKTYNVAMAAKIVSYADI